MPAFATTAADFPPAHGEVRRYDLQWERWVFRAPDLTPLRVPPEAIMWPGAPRLVAAARGSITPFPAGGSQPPQAA